MHRRYGWRRGWVALAVVVAASCGGGGGGGGGVATTFALTVAKVGAGAGQVGSAPAGITCGAACSASFAEGAVVTLSATPDAGSDFGGWTGDCAGAGPTTNVTVSAARTCTARFDLAPASTATLSVAKEGSGGGRVTSAPAGIDCGPTCSATLGVGASLVLTAVVDAGSAFVAWGGACAGNALSTTVVLTADRACVARFDLSGGGGLSDEGYHLVGLGGIETATKTDIVFAGGAVAQSSPYALYAVNVRSGQGAQIGAAGQWRAMDRSADLPLSRLGSLRASGMESSFDAATGRITDLRVRYSIYAHGNRLYKVNHVALPGPPLPQLWGAITTDQVCLSPDTFRTSDIVDLGRHWLFTSPGVDGRCNSTDDVHQAMAYDAGPTDAPIVLPGRVFAVLHDDARRVSGYIVNAANRTERVDADFGNAVAVAAGSGAASLGLLGTGAARHWVFTATTLASPLRRIFAHDLVGGGAATELASFASGEVFLGAATESGAMYIRLGNLSSGRVRVLRLDADLSIREIATQTATGILQGTELATPMRISDTRLVFALTDVVYSVPKTGGVPIALSSPALPYLGLAGGFLVAGETVWFPSTLSLVGSSKLAVVDADAANAATVDVTSWVTQFPLLPMLPRVCTRECRYAALTLNEGTLSASATNAGSDVVTRDGASRVVIATHGRFPSAPTLAFGSVISSPRQLGQAGLASFYAPAAGGSFTLYRYRTDAVGFAAVPVN